MPNTCVYDPIQSSHGIVPHRDVEAQAKRTWNHLLRDPLLGGGRAAASLRSQSCAVPLMPGLSEVKASIPKKSKCSDAK